MMRRRGGSGRGRRLTLCGKEPEVLYAVGDRVRCDEVRAALDTPSEACWGPVYFRRQ